MLSLTRFLSVNFDNITLLAFLRLFYNKLNHLGIKILTLKHDTCYICTTYSFLLFVYREISYEMELCGYFEIHVCYELLIIERNLRLKYHAMYEYELVSQ